MSIVELSPEVDYRKVSEKGCHTGNRPRVEGKFFARGGQKFRIKGVTYGPFAPNPDGHQFPPRQRVLSDFVLMQSAHINSVRTYHIPPHWFLTLADEHGMNVFIDVPWPKHLCFLDSEMAKDHARKAVRAAAELGRSHPSVLAYSICNEIPTNVVRWHGSERVEQFLRELRDVAKQADPDGLVTYTNFPPTEYLDLSFFDFLTFNVYLHDPKTFHRYLLHLQNLVGERPLLLGEIGMDTLRHGEEEQAAFLTTHVRESTLVGLAGVFVFSWTDDWHTGGYPIENWAFGITKRDREPKKSYFAIADVFKSSTVEMLSETPRVSVIVCTYNGGKTLDQCLRSLQQLNYPDYEIIVVDDGSTDNTREILERSPAVRSIHQTNHGLSHARNTGLNAATGELVAYTDSDCYADPEWLTHLVDQLQRTNAAAVGGPNFSPEDGWLAACVAASPGQPTHILETDQEAEHIPGCNMAFRRQALLGIGGFDYQYRKAGDDVDVCWRLQHAGMWITFAPGAFVWHHRRQTPRAFLQQQAGYGEAEALLRFKHPDRFNTRGGGKWRGVLYGPSARGIRVGKPIVERGVFATGLFQTIYQPGQAHWAMIPGTLEWHLLVCLVAVAWVFKPVALVVAAGMLTLSWLVAVLLAVQARLAPEHDGFFSRWLIAVLAYLQPIVRSWNRYHTRLFDYRHPKADPTHVKDSLRPLPLAGVKTAAFWSETGNDRTELLHQVISYLDKRGWGKTIDSGWSDWDLEIYCHPWTIVQITTAQEEHGGQKHLLRVRFCLRPSSYLKALGSLALLSAFIAVGLFVEWPAPFGAALFLIAAVGGAALCFAAWWRGTFRASQAVAVVDAMAADMGLIPCGKNPAPRASP